MKVEKDLKNIQTKFNKVSEYIDEEKNIAEGIDTSKLSIHSTRVINWKCPNGHTFKGKVITIYKRKNKCFYCTGRETWIGENDLETKFPEIAEEFDVEKNGITPNKVSPKDTKSYWWTCKNNHPSFYQSVSHRVTRKTMCPYCSGRKIISSINDLQTLFPEIAKEWDAKKNGGIMPKDVSPLTYNSYYWICPKGHSYRKKVIKRTKYHKQIDCPKCIKAYSTSFPEQAIYYYVRKCFPDAINRYREPFEKGMELDIYIPSYKIGIEYDGQAFHNDEEQHKREYRKYLICKKLGIRLIRIKETTNTWKDTSDTIYHIKKRMNDEEMSMQLFSIFSSIFVWKTHSFKTESNKEVHLNRYYGFPTDFNITRDRPEILEYLVNVEQSFGNRFPELAIMWCKDENRNLTPYMFTPGSNYPVFWKCPRCGNTWKSPISSIVQRKARLCKTCSMKENGKTITKVKTMKHGSLAKKSEKLLKQWDYEANRNLSPYEIPLNYSKKIGWKCDKCGYRWKSSPNSRVRAGVISDCPHCIGRVAMSGVDDFETLYPEIAREWDYKNNKDMLPSQIKPYTNKKIYWICETCGKSYSSYPGNRIQGSGCPICARNKTRIKNSKLVGQYSENGKLIKTYQGLHQAAKEMNVVPNSIFQAVKNSKKSKGFYWKYVNEEKK